MLSTEIAQLDFEGKQIPVCLGCGLPWQNNYNRWRHNPYCDQCRDYNEEEKIECDGYNCNKEYFIEDLYPEIYCFTPWDDEKPDGNLYCQTCIDSGNDDIDHDLFWCSLCERKIACSNGRMYYYRILNSELVCLKCISETLKEGGIAALDDENILESVITEGTPWGMFFNIGELEDEGWETIPNWCDTRFDSSYSEDLANTCKELYEKNLPFIIAYESLSIMGDEGYISIYTKSKC